MVCIKAELMIYWVKLTQYAKTKKVSKFVIRISLMNLINVLPLKYPKKVSPWVGGKFQICSDIEKQRKDSTPKEQIPDELKRKLAPVTGRYLS